MTHFVRVDSGATDGLFKPSIKSSNLKSLKQARWGWAIVTTLSLHAIGVQPADAEPPTVAVPITETATANLNQPLTAVAALSNWQVGSPEHPNVVDGIAASSLMIAGADNFNPGLKLPPPKSETFHPSSSTLRGSTVKGLERLQTDYRNDRDNFGQHNRWMEQTAQFRLQSGDQIRFKTGFNVFSQRKVESVSNLPLQLGWEHKLGNFNLNVAAGIDVFDRLPISPNVALEVVAPLFPSVTLTGVVEQGAYKSNAQTLGHGISALRYGTNLYWQMDKNTSLFALYRRGNYSDDNREEQLFSRLEHKFGQFSIAANLFTWSFDQNAESRKGYFSPPDFLLYSGEVAWQGNVFPFLRCRLAAALGRQRLNGVFIGGNTYQTLCTVKVAPNIEADVGYLYSNVQNHVGGGNAYENQSVVGQLRVLF